MLIIDPELITVDVSASDAESVIHLLADKLHAYGAVEPDYGAATVKREQNHPTGLPTKPFCIAFPHADADGVNQSALGFAALREVVTFRNMGDPEEELPVELVFLLANNSPEEQVQILRNLAIVFGQPEKLVALRALSLPSEIASWLRKELDLG